VNWIPPELQVTIPSERIAQYPARERGASRLLVLDRAEGRIVHVGIFRDIVQFTAGDLIVLNDTKVIPARVEGRRPGGGFVELLFLVEGNAEADETDEVETLIRPSRRLRPGLRIQLPGGASLELTVRCSGGRWRGSWKEAAAGEGFRSWLDRVGASPLPPYIRRRPEPSDRERYQTVFAHWPESLAAPTAGLHFTPEILDAMTERGSSIVRMTLAVGLGTFQPIRDGDLTGHRMESERYRIPSETAGAMNSAQTSGRPVTAVGTTVVRALESTAAEGWPLKPRQGNTDLFIFPPYRFRAVDRLLTNFHRPDSTLIQLVAAFAGWELVNLSYRTALEAGFGFYSYGDAMLIL